MQAFSSFSSGQSSCRKTLKQLVAHHVRQCPCLLALIPQMPCRRRSESYRTLGQDEEESGVQVTDDRQVVNKRYGQVMVRLAILLAVGVTIKATMNSSQIRMANAEKEHVANSPAKAEVPLTREQEFHRDAPVVLYMAVIEILASGACALTASMMYLRRRHSLQHPSESTGRTRNKYLKVQLEKDVGTEDQKLYGLGFRPSSDGLECLLVESIRRGSLVDKWNMRVPLPSAEAILEEALGDGLSAAHAEPQRDDITGIGPRLDANNTSAMGGARTTIVGLPPRNSRVHPGCAIVAVNDVCADVGMMQAQLMKPKVTLWVQSNISHASQIEDELLEAQSPEAEDTSGSTVSGSTADSATVVGRPVAEVRDEGRGDIETAGPAAGPSVAPGDLSSNVISFPQILAILEGSVAPSPPRCACMALEDEAPQILTRWCACSLIFGWVTLLPVLLMQPHEERPRQQLFRQFLLKPALLVLPLWLLLWFVDCLQLLFEYEIMSPFAYFGIVHMFLPAVLVWYLFQMQAADDEVVLEQRRVREKEAGSGLISVVEDPTPTILKELVMMNPVALVWLGCCCAIPLVAVSLLTPMNTARGRMAQGYVNIIYLPMVFLQSAALYTLYHLAFLDMTRMYLEGVVALFTIPCFAVWCFCVLCASRYGRADLALARQQRLERGREALARSQINMDGLSSASGSGPGQPANEKPAREVVDCSEAYHREFELIFSA